MKKTMLIVVLVSICVLANAQADLAITGNVVATPNPVHVGITMNVTFSVKNVSTSSAAGATHTGIYLSPTTDASQGKLLSEISLEPLQAGTTSSIQFNYPIPYNVVTSSGTYYVIIKLNDENEISESSYVNNSGNASIQVNNAPWAAQNIPYPIIFVHGYNSNNKTWNNLIDSLQSFYGWSYGGNMNFCLNYDANTSTSNKNSDYHDFTDIPSLHSDDYYTVNFDVNYDGTPYSNSIYNESNQSAIVKQGLAIRDAIKHVLAKTGKDKVILVCHSMGGLAAREYLQNSSIWQEPNINHHVAKLVTVGTPHGGTNITDFGIDLSIGVDLQSEAIRDLRTSYFASGQQGAYLFNGAEDNDYLKDQLLYDFHNVDVNCNGTPNDWITGINKKSIPINLTYSSVIGINNGGANNTDGIVGTEQANINNYRPVNADTFILKEPFSDPNLIWHIEETSQFAGIMRGMDDPPNDFINGHAYSISSGQLYYGNITDQSNNSPQRDYDSYIINAPSTGNLNIQVYDIPTLFYSIDVFNSSNTPVYSFANHGKSYINTDVPVTKGNYYVVLSGIPDANSYRYSYAFKCTFSATTTYCSGTANITDASGSISDGSATNNYSNNSDCRWKIQPSGAKNITLNFTAFDVSNPGDTVYVYNGGLTTSPLLWKGTGNTLPAKIKSTGGTILVRVSSDAANTAAGWKANYSSATVPVYCSGTTTLTEATGYISDGSDTSSYGNNSHCSWIISPVGAYSVTLNFVAFSTEANKDIVKVYDGRDNTAPLLGSFSGNKIPPNVTSSGGAMFVEFITNSTTTAGGWSASYTSYIPYSTTGIVKYESWFDNNYRSKVAVSVMPQDTLRLNTGITTTGVSTGLHSFHIRFLDKKNKWSSVINQFFIKTPQASGINGMTAYEYWFDNNYAGKVTQTFSRQDTYQLVTGLSANGLTQGLHSFHIRFQNAGGGWSSVINQFIIYTSSSSVSKINAYEYWFDNNYAGKISQTVTATQPIYQLVSNLSVGSLSQGLHAFHIRFKDGGRIWSATINQFIIYTPAGGISQINRYEYWFDSKYAQKVSVNISSPVEIFTLNTSLSIGALSTGSHILHIRFRQSNNLWSSVLSQKFKKVAALSIADINVSTDKLTFTDKSPLFVYPNPSSGKFTVGIDNDVSITSIKIVDGNGRIVYANTSLNKVKMVEVNLSKHASGTYYIEAADGKKIFNKKIVIER